MTTDILVINEIMVQVCKEYTHYEEGNNRRPEKRYPTHACVQWGNRNPVTSQFEKRAKGWVKNISHTGIQLLAGEPIEPGTKIDIDLEGLGACGHFVTCQAVHCHQLLINTYEIGLTFL